MQKVTLSLRIDSSSPTHHLWNNNGTWWFHATAHSGLQKQRIRLSLKTRDLAQAQLKRDEIIAKLTPSSGLSQFAA